MMQFVYRNKLYLMGRIGTVASHLRELSSQYKTVKEYLESKTRYL
ncbi:hypothetical protein SDC9_199048 [bioreactor metagenome]|uniref:Uncharacterized protein n=1 Tax=bioreactor metagenome TaxID=1076179 RepID=A0A645IW40_9ZZZZ